MMSVRVSFYFRGRLGSMDCRSAKRGPALC